MAIQNLIELNEQYVTVEGIQIRYVSIGNGPPLLLVHGFGEFIEVWIYNIPSLSERFTVYAMDMPGHGKSEEPGQEYNLPFATKFITSFINAMGIQRTNMIGHSLGGLACLSVTLDFPDKVDKLILVDSDGFSKETPLIYRLATLPLLGEIMLKPTVKAAIRAGMKKRFYNPELITEEWVDLSFKYMKMPKTKDTLLNIVRSNTTINGFHPEVVITDKLHLVNVPTLIIHGMQDTVIPIQQAREASNLIPHAKLKVIEKCGHNPHLEKPEEFNQAVLEFLTNDQP